MKKPVLWLLNPWIHDFAAYNLWSRPLGLLQVAERLSAYDVELHWVDCLATVNPSKYHTGKYFRQPLPVPAGLKGVPRQYSRYGLPPAEVVAAMRRLPRPDAILATTVMTYWYPGAAEAIALCKRLHPRTPVVLGGIYSRLFPEHARTHTGADIVFTGTADQGLEALLARLGCEATPVRPPQPFYRLNLFPLDGFAPLLTSEGCPFRCSYCASGLLYPAFRQKPPEEVVADIMAMAGLGVEDFAFYDDALLARAQTHLQPILRAVVAANKKMRYHTPNGLHARYLDASIARLMKQAGFRTVRLGLETTSPERQTATGGKVDNRLFLDAVGHLRQAGFPSPALGAYLMYGLPGQSLDEIIAGVDFAMQAGIRVHLTEFSPLPGTPAWSECVRCGMMPADIDPVLTNNTVFSQIIGAYPPRALKAMKDRVAVHNQNLL